MRTFSTHIVAAFIALSSIAIAQPQMKQKPLLKAQPKITVNHDLICARSDAFKYKLSSFSEASTSFNTPYMALYFMKALNPCEQGVDSAFVFGHSDREEVYWTTFHNRNYKNRMLARLARFGITQLDVVEEYLAVGQSPGFGVVIMSSATTMWIIGFNNAIQGLGAGNCNYNFTGVYNAPTDNSFLNPPRATISGLQNAKVPDFFNVAALGHYPRVAEKIRTQLGGSSKSIVCAGFDYSGPIMLMLAYYLEANSSINVHAVYTFGAYRLIEGSQNANIVSDLLSAKFFSADYVNTGDEQTKYQALFFMPSSRLYTMGGKGAITNGGSTLQRSFTTNDRSNHSIADYLEKLYTAYINPVPIYKDCLPAPSDD